MIASRLVIIVMVLLGTTCPVAAWTPPIGIPEPGWGITTPTPPIPNPWTGAVARFYYVDYTNPAATDTPSGDLTDANGNRYGWPASPRVTIPLALPASAVVYLAPGKAYNESHRAPNAIIAKGTASATVFITSSPTNGALAGCGWELAGTYLLVENVHFHPGCPGGTDGSPIIEDQTTAGGTGNSDHIAFRNSEHEGQTGCAAYPCGNNGQIGGDHVLGGKVTNIIVYNDLCHHNGRYRISDPIDDDLDCWTVSENADHIWIVDSTFYSNSNTGVQVNPCGSGVAGCSWWNQTHHIYIGRNTAHDLREDCFFSKTAQDVIISQNTCYNIFGTIDGSGAGYAIGTIYAPDNVWIIFNRIYNSEYGIVAGSDSGGPGTSLYYVGNVIYNTTLGPYATPWNPDDPYSYACIHTHGGQNIRVVNNTLSGCPNGIDSPSGNTIVMVNNIISNLSCAPSMCTGGNHVYIHPAGAASDVAFTDFDPTAVIRWDSGSTVYSLPEFQATFPGKGSGNIQGSPQFVNLAAGDFHLRAGSPARGRGAVDDVYAIFEARYGLSIKFDFDARPRSGGTWDIGAYSFRGQPAAPTNLRVTP